MFNSHCGGDRLQKTGQLGCIVDRLVTCDGTDTWMRFVNSRQPRARR